MLFAKKYLLNLLSQKDEENERLKTELAKLRTIAGHRVETEETELRPCAGVACAVCAYSSRYDDSEGGYMMMCVKNVSCPDFRPKSLICPD